MNNAIPPITDPLGKHWRQPSPEGILIDDTHAAMSKSDWENLAEYSCSIPSGVYPGKMWKTILPDGQFLRWYSESHNEGMCDINARIALVV